MFTMEPMCYEDYGYSGMFSWENTILLENLNVLYFNSKDPLGLEDHCACAYARVATAYNIMIWSMIW